MATAHCPKCGGVIEGDLTAITRHIKVCGRAPKRSRSAVAPSATAATAVPGLPWEIRVPLVISSQNTSTYSHWSVYKRGKDSWSMALGLLLRPVAGLRLQWSEWRITRCWAHPRRELDFGNFIGGCKGPIDCLTANGVIVDDRPANFLCQYRQLKATESYTLFTLLRTAHERPIA